MPRKTASSSDLKAADTDEGTTSYLDSFLESITEQHNLPSELKKHLAQIRDLDQQAHEHYERIQKQTKNHIARAKRSVQQGKEPDEDLMHKARAPAPAVAPIRTQFEPHPKPPCSECVRRPALLFGDDSHPDSPLLDVTPKPF